MIRPAAPSDIPAMCEIYNYYITHTIVTFEEEPVDAAEMGRRFQAAPQELPWYVYEENGGITAFAYLHPYNPRSAYRFTLEDTVYVRNGWQKNGVGTQLLRLLIEDARRLGKHSIMAALGIPNDASEALHRKCGFQKMADLDEVGFKFGKWASVGLWKLRL